MMTNNTYNMSITGEVSPQMKEIILNDQLNTNAGSNSATGNDDASHEGVNMDTGLGNQSNHTVSAEVSGKKKRSAYDGSYAHGVTADSEHVQTITAYNNAEDRLIKRRLYLIGQYEELRTSYGATADVGERAKLLKKKSALESQIKAVNKIRETLSSIKGEIEATERAAQANVEFMDYDAA